MLDDIREWISDNLRYILLGLALILVLVVAVLGIRAISNIASGRMTAPAEKQSETQTESTNDVIVQETGEPAQSGTFVQNDAKVLTTMTSYFNARTNGDTETLRKLYPAMDEREEASLTNSYVEKYSNITTYSKPGLTEGSYVVYVCFDSKVRDIDTLVPNLYMYYLQSNESGDLYIIDAEGDQAVEAFCEETRQSTEVQNLLASVEQSVKDAEASDPALAEFMSKYGTSRDTDTPEDESESTEIVALDTCNVRSEPNTDSDENIIGSLYMGETAVKVGETDGWTQIEFNGETAYVSSDFVSTPEEAQAADEASYFAPAAAGEDNGTADDGSGAGDGTVDDGSAGAGDGTMGDGSADGAIVVDDGSGTQL